jgi:hypothetical protein
MDAMHANDVRELMDSALDGGELSTSLKELLGESPELAAEWERQQRVHHLLAADPLVDPPMDFALRVMGRLEGELRRAPRWQRHLQQIALILAGTLTLTWSAVTLSRHWQLTDVGPTLWALMDATARGTLAMGGAWLSASTASAWGWLVYGALAIMLAAAWFGVLVLPRSMTRQAGSEVQR